MFILDFIIFSLIVLKLSLREDVNLNWDKHVNICEGNNFAAHGI